MSDSYDSMFGLAETPAFDTYTGQELPEVAEKRQEEAVQVAQEEAQAIVTLSQHPGWKHVVGLIKKDIELNVDGMLYASHPETLMRMQERVKAKKDFLTWLEIKVAERDYLVDEQKALA